MWTFQSKYTKSSFICISENSVFLLDKVDKEEKEGRVA